ncbi:atlastin [Alkalihalobacillus sp. MEB130]|uniref:hypothetical protein n=1 Tax=Alkalihalobacillus sp. MEB130 TaxID=2976704 RepID=UPI0028DE7237|nr:hypothetical protein [Alkalihalobacillus sp. MEB130]MDT8858882.1 atlastin [Alkalihalobacillus sp. MEB130]
MTTVSTWEIDNMRNTVKYITNGSIILTDHEAVVCLSFLDMEGEEIQGIVRAEYFYKDENQTFEGLLVFTNYRVLFFSYDEAKGETGLDFLQYYEYYAISQVSSLFDTSTYSKLTFEYNGSFQESVVFQKINQSVSSTLVSLITHYASIRKAKDYKKPKKRNRFFQGGIYTVVGIMAFLFIIGVIAAIFEDEEYAEEYEVIEAVEAFDEIDPYADIDYPIYDIQVENSTVTVEELLQYQIGDSYFTDNIEPPNYDRDYPTIFNIEPDDNILYYVVEMTTTNLSNENLDMLFDVPIRFTLVEDDFYEFYPGFLYLINNASDFAFDYELALGEEIDMYLYFEVPEKLKDNDHKIDLHIENMFDYEDPGLTIQLR